jgi:hypothetical protein
MTVRPYTFALRVIALRARYGSRGLRTDRLCSRLFRGLPVPRCAAYDVQTRSTLCRVRGLHHRRSAPFSTRCLGSRVAVANLEGCASPPPPFERLRRLGLYGSGAHRPGGVCRRRAVALERGRQGEVRSCAGRTDRSTTRRPVRSVGIGVGARANLFGLRHRRGVGLTPKPLDRPLKNWKSGSFSISPGFSEALSTLRIIRLSFLGRGHAEYIRHARASESSPFAPSGRGARGASPLRGRRKHWLSRPSVVGPVRVSPDGSRRRVRGGPRASWRAEEERVGLAGSTSLGCDGSGLGGGGGPAPTAGEHSATAAHLVLPNG